MKGERQLPTECVFEETTWTEKSPSRSTSFRASSRMWATHWSIERDE